jgi:aerobic-type carbon monoxide dehydrogenase small subunit (CoxS/CutS family)
MPLTGERASEQHTHMLQKTLHHAGTRQQCLMRRSGQSWILLVVCPAAVCLYPAAGFVGEARVCTHPRCADGGGIIIVTLN